MLSVSGATPFCARSWLIWASNCATTEPLAAGGDGFLVLVAVGLVGEGVAVFFAELDAFGVAVGAPLGLGAPAGPT